MYNQYGVTICKTTLFSLKLRDLIEPWKGHIVVIERLECLIERLNQIKKINNRDQ